MRIAINGEVTLPANTTEEYAMWAPQGFRWVSAGFQHAEAYAGVHLTASYPDTDLNPPFNTSGSRGTFADGSEAISPSKEGWRWEFMNTTGSAKVIYLMGILEETDNVGTLDYTGGGSYPVVTP